MKIIVVACMLIILSLINWAASSPSKNHTKIGLISWIAFIAGITTFVIVN